MRDSVMSDAVDPTEVDLTDIAPLDPEDVIPGSDAVGVVEADAEDEAEDTVDSDDPRQLLLATLLRHADASKWVGSPFEAVKRVSNTKVGSVGQDFLEDFATGLGLRVRFPVNAQGKRAARGPWDIELEGITFELKTATEDVNGKYQFNHIRYHRPYDAVVCLGISPTDIVFGLWSKADVATGRAGRLVPMEKNGNASYKLTKGADQLKDINEFSASFATFSSHWHQQNDS